jgi:hypothetical protein
MCLVFILDHYVPLDSVERLFEIYSTLADQAKRRQACWPLIARYGCRNVAQVSLLWIHQYLVFVCRSLFLISPKNAAKCCKAMAALTPPEQQLVCFFNTRNVTGIITNEHNTCLVLSSQKKFLESLKKVCRISSFIPCLCRFHELVLPIRLQGVASASTINDVAVQCATYLCSNVAYIHKVGNWIAHREDVILSLRRSVLVSFQVENSPVGAIAIALAPVDEELKVRATTSCLDLQYSADSHPCPIRINSVA